MGTEETKSKEVSSSKNEKIRENVGTQKSRKNPTTMQLEQIASKQKELQTEAPESGSATDSDISKSQKKAVINTSSSPSSSSVVKSNPTPSDASTTATVTATVTIAVTVTNPTPTKVKGTSEPKANNKSTFKPIPKPTPAPTTTPSNISKTSENTGNDRVTVDKAKTSLVPSGGSTNSVNIDMDMGVTSNSKGNGEPSSSSTPQVGKQTKSKTSIPVQVVKARASTSSSTTSSSSAAVGTESTSEKQPITSTTSATIPSSSLSKSLPTQAVTTKTTATSPQPQTATSTAAKTSTVQKSAAPSKTATTSTSKPACSTPNPLGFGSNPNSLSSNPTVSQSIIKKPLGGIGLAPQSSVALASTPPAVLDEQTILEEKIKKQRLPLTDKYGSFIIASDTCLEDARSRLRTAIEQTRQLRTAFTERVYGKYRVCLRPPSPTEQILTRILQDPASAAQELNQEISTLRREKEVEKKEAQKLSAEMVTAAAKAGGMPASNGQQDGSESAPKNPVDQPTDALINNSSEPQTSETSKTAPAENPLAAVNAENADQLMYISAGLSLIVLPEQDASSIDMSPYSDRAPINPATGQRVKSISAAAAAAGEVMLDRARKGAAMRAERRRRLQLAGSRADSTEIDTSYSRLSILTNPSLTTPPPIPAAPVTKAASSSKVDPKVSIKTPIVQKEDLSANTSATKKSASRTDTATPPDNSIVKRSQSKVSAPTGSSLMPSVTAKAIRARVQATMSVQTLLSLSPSTEELRPDGRISAATLALMERGVGTHGQNTKANNHQRYRHPFPDSLGARRRALQSSNHPNAKQDALLHPAYTPLSLPPTPTTKDRRNSKRLSNLIESAEERSSRRASHAIDMVLRQFLTGVTSSDGSDKHLPHKKRRLSEISFLHGLRKAEGNLTSRNKSGPESQCDKQKPIDPLLALHVMQAVGVITPSQSTVDSVPKEPSFSDVLDTTLFSIAEMRAYGGEDGTTKRSIQVLKALNQEFVENKKRSFSAAFLELRNSTKAHQCSDNSSVNMEDISQKDTVVAGNEDPKAPVLEIRGGGEAQKDNTSKGKLKKGSAGEAAKDNNGAAESTAATASKRGPTTLQNSTGTSQTGLWNGTARQSLVLLNPPQQTRHSAGQSGSIAGQMSGNEHYHPNAIQLANQLRLSRMPQQGTRGPGDLAEYIGSLHPQSSVAYDWSSIGAASAAVASAQSFAALGISPHRTALVNFPLQDRARAMMRDQQNAAVAVQAAAAHRQQQQALAYLSSGYPAGAPSPFVHMSGAMLNPSTFLGQQSVAQIPLPAQMAPSRTGKKRNEKGPNGTANSASADPKNHDSKHDKATSSQHVDKESSKSRHEAEPKSGLKRKSEHQDGRNDQPAKAARKSEREDISKREPLSNERSEGVVEEQEAAAKTSTSSIGQDKSNASFTQQDGNQSVNATKRKAGSDCGLQFFVPPVPSEVPADVASMVLQGHCFEAIEALKGVDSSSSSKLLSYISAVGTAVPIPKALVSTLFKEKVMAASERTSGIQNIPQSSRDLAVATILLWLWKNHEECFQGAFAKSGRIDVDPDCKWLIASAVDKAVETICLAIEASPSKPGTQFSIAFAGIKAKGSTLTDSEKMATGITLDLQVTAMVSNSLSFGICLEIEMDCALPNFNKLIDYLDEMRKNALYSKSQERALLAALISRKATMSLPFSHAYVSSVVRAGEALGHGELFEVVQNEEVKVSTMIPYDVFTDESGAWEDPCRPSTGFSPNLTGDDMMRRAHARAMMQKSLKKLQDRHNIKGGTPGPGAYTDPPNSASNTSESKSSNAPSSTTPRGWFKRRSSLSEPPVRPGTGSAAATSWALYEPKHISAPLEWKSNHIENTPYGRHDSGTRPRSLSLSQFGTKHTGRRKKQPSRSMSFASAAQLKASDANEGDTKRSTREIPWVRVAGIFQNVALSGSAKTQEASNKALDQTIVAPFVRQIRFEELDSDSEEESDSEEDISDKTVLEKHQEVLDKMKDHLSAFLEARKKSQEKKKIRTSKP